MEIRDRQRVHHAYDLAKLAHSNQYRDTGEEYFEHVCGVALILVRYGYGDAHHIILGLMHDVLEKSFITRSFVEGQFGPQIASDVTALSKLYCIEDSTFGAIRTIRKTDEAYYEEVSHSNEPVILAKGSDRINNLSSFPREDDESKWPQEKRIRKILETRRWMIPAVAKYNQSMALELTRLCDELEQTAHRIISTRPPPADPLKT